MRKSIYLIIAILMIACNGSKKNLPIEFDFGKAKNGIYTNSFFEMEIFFNPDWVVQDKNQMNNLVEVGSGLLSGDDKNMKRVLEASKVNTAYLLAIFKYEVGSVVEYNPSFLVVAENIKNFPEIKNGEDYLLSTKKILEQSQMAHSFEKEIYEETRGTSKFHILETKIDMLDKTVIQEYRSTAMNGFILSFVISYTTEAEKKELYRIIEDIKL